jgi:hypothetical protein
MINNGKMFLCFVLVALGFTFLGCTQKEKEDGQNAEPTLEAPEMEEGMEMETPDMEESMDKEEGEEGKDMDNDREGG